MLWLHVHLDQMVAGADQRLGAPVSRLYVRAMTATTDAFADFRRAYPAKQLSTALVADEDQVRPMTPEDGLRAWMERDGVDVVSSASGSPPPMVTIDRKKAAHLWVVTPSDVKHAAEHCLFGTKLSSGVVKHSNLTGGGTAHCGGELLFETDDTIIFNGMSGRYGPRSEEELRAVALAFRCSGYVVWSMGWDEETNRPMPFIGAKPVLVE